MKRPVAYLSALFICIILSTVVVSTAVAGILRSFYKAEMENSMNVKATPVESESNDLIHLTNVKL